MTFHLPRGNHGRGPLGLPRGAANPVLTSPVVIQTAARLGVTPAQVALRWLLRLALNVLLIPAPPPSRTCWKTSPPRTWP